MQIKFIYIRVHVFMAEYNYVKIIVYFGIIKCKKKICKKKI